MIRRRSKKRDAILAVLQKSHNPLSAAMIHHELPDIDLVTIYRNLELFAESKELKKFHFDGAEAHYEYQHEPHHHAICSDCDRVLHFKAPDQKIIKLLGLSDFDVEELEVIVKGRCK
jgi:Fur family peroxide stress response transcriptional regulator